MIQPVAVEGVGGGGIQLNDVARLLWPLWFPSMVHLEHFSWRSLQFEHKTLIFNMKRDQRKRKRHTITSRVDNENGLHYGAFSKFSDQRRDVVSPYT